MLNFSCFKEGSFINQVVCAVLINLPVFTYGAAIGWMSPMTLLLQSDKSPRGERLTDTEISLMAALPYIVCCFFNFLIVPLADRIGRKPILMFASSTGLLCFIIKLLSVETWAFMLARSMVGIMMSGAYVISPMYTKEISEDCIRGSLGSLVILFHVNGNLFVYIIGDVLSYHAVLWVLLSIPTAHFVMFMFMPESPSFLVKKGRHEEATRSLAWLRCRNETDNFVLKELALISREQKNDEESSGFALKAILNDKLLSKAFSIAIIVSLAREVCGAIPVLSFAGDIFANASEGTGLVLTPNQQAMMLGAVQVAGSGLASSVVEKAGRKPLLFVTSLISGISMCMLASWFLARTYGILAVAWLPITSLCVCIFCDASGLQPMSVVLIGEIFSYKYRGTVTACAMSITSFSAFIQMLFFKPLASNIGAHVAFYFFGLVCIAAALYIIVVVPETKMKSIEEIYEKLKSNKDRQLEIKGQEE